MSRTRNPTVFAKGGGPATRRQSEEARGSALLARVEDKRQAHGAVAVVATHFIHAAGQVPRAGLPVRGPGRLAPAGALPPSPVHCCLAGLCGARQEPASAPCAAGGSSIILLPRACCPSAAGRRLPVSAFDAGDVPRPEGRFCGQDVQNCTEIPI